MEREAVWEQVQLRVRRASFRLAHRFGGGKEFSQRRGRHLRLHRHHVLFDVCREVVTFREMEEMEENLILPTFRKLKFVDCNKPFWKTDV